ncbi:hypothetical protein Pint_27571 [Pistacia integerrima]|uniref:Uncharacterized protein n=1 Tax=Pistacia integerrima TaxID=434235 RepID=A0ACC0YSP0_9ROSI|nr:hypothetical protein Pint_27571 [Pistacia integerrima]
MELKGRLTASLADFAWQHQELLWEVEVMEQRITEFSRERLMNYLEMMRDRRGAGHEVEEELAQATVGLGPKAVEGDAEGWLVLCVFSKPSDMGVTGGREPDVHLTERISTSQDGLIEGASVTLPVVEMFARGRPNGAVILETILKSEVSIPPFRFILVVMEYLGEMVVSKMPVGIG